MDTGPGESQSDRCLPTVCRVVLLRCAGQACASDSVAVRCRQCPIWIECRQIDNINQPRPLILWLVERRGFGYALAMTRYGVKTKSGKVVWVLADAVEMRDGVLLFVSRGDGCEKTIVIAGFNLDVVDHFGRPDAFATDSNGSQSAPGEDSH
jgi:hypothetical protein